MLQANPGLTPPLVKAILQYTAEPLPGFNLLEQGAGLINIPGAVAVSSALASNIAARAAAGTIHAGDNLLAAGKSLPAPVSVIEGRSFSWSGLVLMGGNQVLGGSALLRKFQAAYDPTVTWVGSRVREIDADTYNGTNYISGFEEVPASSGTLVSPGVVSLTAYLASGTAIFAQVPDVSCGPFSGPWHRVFPGHRPFRRDRPG